MTKRILLTFAALLLMATAWAVPAKRGQWRLLTLKDGTEVKAELRGDEFCHYWQTEDGICIVEQDDGYVVVEDLEALKSRGRRRRVGAARSLQARRPTSGAWASRRELPEFPAYTGKKRGLIILAEFSNKKFETGHDQEFFDRMANKVGFISKEGFIGSVHDYFLDQSNGLFDLTFDVVGPVKLPRTYRYYGQNDVEGDDLRAGEMAAQACQLVDELVNYSDYDWYGDGKVDMVMIIFAGKGEADGGVADTIWPHEWELSESDYGEILILDGMEINIYACVNEMKSSGVNGIGTICHEFSHCIGLPDMYDLYTNNYGMGSWSLMDAGSYNGDSFCPANYTSFEKMSVGWLEPEVLSSDTTITDMKSMSQGGNGYLLQNEGCADEFYLIENRQRTGWDTFLPASGLLILHIDYDDNIWYLNEVNSTSKQKTMSGNDHQRCTIFHADNSTRIEAGDAYPYGGNDQLTAISKPAAKLYHNNGDAGRFMGKAITDITLGDNGTMSFTVGPQQYGTDGIASLLIPADALPHPSAIYSLDGRCLGTDLLRLKPGLYVVGGRKVIK